MLVKQKGGPLSFVSCLLFLRWHSPRFVRACARCLQLRPHLFGVCAFVCVYPKSTPLRLRHDSEQTRRAQHKQIIAGRRSVHIVIRHLCCDVLCARARAPRLVERIAVVPAPCWLPPCVEFRVALAGEVGLVMSSVWMVRC